MLYASEVIYVAVQVLAKTSILLLYLRVFTHRWFTIACNLCIVFLVLHGIAFTLVVSFQCKPVESFWNPRVTGKCINLTATGVAGAIISIVEDLVILILPIPEIINLQMNKSKKWGLVLLFGIGSLWVSISNYLDRPLVNQAQCVSYERYQTKILYEFWKEFRSNL